MLNATFSFAGVEYAAGPVGGEDPEQAIEAEIAEVLWQTLGQAPSRTRSLEQQIVQAALDGRGHAPCSNSRVHPHASQQQQQEPLAEKPVDDLTWNI